MASNWFLIDFGSMFGIAAGTVAWIFRNILVRQQDSPDIGMILSELRYDEP